MGRHGMLLLIGLTLLAACDMGEDDPISQPAVEAGCSGLFEGALLDAGGYMPCATLEVGGGG